ncbi:MAG: chemotaxis response regulator protein-glutamate methylesterase [Polyangiaceae bacterium]
MKPIRVLIVDDSVVVRRLLSEILATDPEIDVVGTAASGSIALAKIPQTQPDVVTLDVEMPDMNGLDTLSAIRKAHPDLPVIMFSALTGLAAATTLEALARGATDYVTKPTAVGGREGATAHIREQLLPKVKTLGGGEVARQWVPSAPPRARALPAVLPPPASTRVEVLAVGASTGGPNALTHFFSQLPAHFPVPIVVVQHMPPVFTKLFAERLTAACALEFHEAAGGEVLQPGKAYIAPGDYHMRVVRDGTVTRVELNQDAPENSCRPAVDVLFRSVSAVYGAGTLAVVLTGMGQDGLRGSEAIRGTGGQVIVQDEASSVVWGMPGFIAKAGLAQAVLPLAELSGEVLRRVALSRVVNTSTPNLERHVS